MGLRTRFYWIRLKEESNNNIIIILKFFFVKFSNNFFNYMDYKNLIFFN